MVHSPVSSESTVLLGWQTFKPSCSITQPNTHVVWKPPALHHQVEVTIVVNVRCNHGTLCRNFRSEYKRQCFMRAEEHLKLGVLKVIGQHDRIDLAIAIEIRVQ